MDLADAHYRSHPAFLSSIALHGAIVLLIVLAGLAFSQSRPPPPQVFELVAGQGDNYMATQATALGSEVGVKFNAPPAPPAPEPPTPEAAPPAAALEPVPAEAVPPPPKPAPLKRVKTSAAAASGTAVPNFEKSVRWAQIKAESRIKMHELRLKRAEERKRRIAERLAALAAARKSGVTYEQFLREQAARGRATGVIHGKSMEAGAGGKALTAEQQDAMVAWTELIRERWIDNFVPPTDFTESMMAHVKFYVGADGSISNIRIVRSTGNEAFGQAVIDALQRVSVPPPPSHRGDDYDIDFSLKNED
ncbi:MAG TPA: energy transducer TonB [Opitutaceae bacterium]|jgi:colicin import membrane protein|nr:energy transducer TonB [Opitutaceae bacterium]